MSNGKFKPPSLAAQRKQSERQQTAYRNRIFVGIGVAEPITEATRLAYEHAWEQAKAGRARGPLRVVEHHVDGKNPPNWCRVVLVDDGV